MSKGRIVSVERIENRIVYLQQGIKKHKQSAWAGYPGGNGTYVTGGEYLGTCINVKIFIYDLGHCCTFDIRNAVLQANGRKRVSDKLFRFLKQNEGKKVKVKVNSNSVSFNPWDLPYLVRE